MAPTYAAPSSASEAHTQPELTRPPRPWIKVLWVLQACIALVRMVLVALILVVGLFLEWWTGLSWNAVVIWIYSSLNIWLCSFIVSQVWQQLASAQTVRVALRREMLKAGVAMWLVLSVVGMAMRKPEAYEESDVEEKRVFDEVMGKVGVVYAVVSVVVMAAFYLPLWVAWKDRKGEKQRGEGRGAELKDHAVRLLGRRSVDWADEFVEPGGDKERTKM